MKYIQEEHEKYLSDDGLYRMNGRKYRLGICKVCGEACLHDPAKEEGTANCTHACAAAGRIWKQESKDKIREAKTGVVLSVDHKKSISRSTRGLVYTRFTEEHKENMKIAATGENHYLWMGGVKKLDIPLYNTYAHQLDIETRRNKTDYPNIKGDTLEVQCFCCGKWFVPKTGQVRGYIKSLKGIRKCNANIYCSVECKKKSKKGNIGNQNGNWKGGACELDVMPYDGFASQLEPVEECRKTEEGFLEVKCTYCGIWFVPSRGQVGYRINGINKYDTGRFYCSEGCKKECPIYMKRVDSLIKRDEIASGRILPEELNREVQPELRQLVFLRDYWTCQRCGSKASIHCHHITGIEQNPIESADVDNCITFCKVCHKWIHMNIEGCGYHDLRKPLPC